MDGKKFTLPKGLSRRGNAVFSTCNEALFLGIASEYQLKRPGYLGVQEADHTTGSDYRMKLAALCSG